MSFLELWDKNFWLLNFLKAFNFKAFRQFWLWSFLGALDLKALLGKLLSLKLLKAYFRFIITIFSHQLLKNPINCQYIEDPWKLLSIFNFVLFTQKWLLQAFHPCPSIHFCVTFPLLWNFIFVENQALP